ncbi:MAG TPA: hypothetical protein VJJ28_01875, partial [Candidatus Paceibacterota bacterium]
MFSLVARTATKINSLNLEQDVLDNVMQNSEHAYWKAIESVFRPPIAPSLEVELIQPVTTTSLDQWRSGMVKLYQNHMGLDITPELEKFQWPSELPQGFNWSVFRPQGLTAKMALDKLCKPQFKVVEYINLNDYSLE